MTDWNTARRNMVDSQIRPSSVTDRRIIAALARVPRERFVAAEQRALAYCDEDVPAAATAGGQTRLIMAPMPFARLAHLADIAQSEHVLDVGCATGYSSAVIAALAGSVVALEEDAALAAEAQENLSGIGIDNVAVVQGRLTEGYPSQGPYDAIVLEGAVDEVPRALLGQLAEGGRLVAVVKSGAIGRAHVFVRSGDDFGSNVAFDAAIPPLPGFARKPAFVF